MEFREKIALMKRINEYVDIREKYQRAFQRWLNDPCNEKKAREYRETEKMKNAAQESMYDYVFESL